MNNSSDAPVTKDQIDQLCRTVQDLDPAQASISFTPECGGPVVEALNKLAEAMQQKALEIKEHIRNLTAEELNELDGFGRTKTKNNAEAQRQS